MSSEEDLVIVYSCNQMEAGILKGLLEEKEIPVFLKDQVMGTVAPWFAAAGGAGTIKIMVPADKAEQAKSIIEEFRQREAGEE
jgi:hypothetical protein